MASSSGNGSADFRIRIESTGDTFDVSPDQSILNTLREHGYAVESSCTSGLCGVCRVRYLEGEPDHRDLVLSKEEKTEYLTSCISRCKSEEIVLDLPPPNSDGPIVTPEKPLAIVDQSICVACLTCVRACTYGAATINSDAIGVGGIVGAATVDADECSGCGLCAAACPTGAISMTLFSDSDVISEVGALFSPDRFSSTGAEGRPLSEPWIVSFCCPHSAPSVKAFGDNTTAQPPVGLDIIEMPCTGRIDNLHLMRTFEDGADGAPELFDRILRERGAEFFFDNGLVLRDERLPLVGGKLGIRVITVVFLGDFQRFFEQAVINPEDHITVHLDEAAVAVPSETFIAGRPGKAFDRLVVQAEVEHGVHHARHGNGRARADRHEQRIGSIAKALAHRFFYVAECIGDIRPQLFGKIRTACEIFEAFFGRDGEARGHRQADTGHFGQVRALAASHGLVLLPCIRMRGVPAECEDRLIHFEPRQLSKYTQGDAETPPDPLSSA